MTERCDRCGHRVTVAAAPGSPTPAYSAWCACSQVSSYDSAYRPVGRGTTAEEALQRWREAGRKP